MAAVARHAVLDHVLTYCDRVDCALRLSDGVIIDRDGRIIPDAPELWTCLVCDASWKIPRS